MSDHHDKIGAALRDARQACGLSLDEVAERIHIRPVYLQAIEAGQFELLPAIPQRLGFTRCYADFLQIDLGDDLNKLSEEVNDHVSQTDYSAPALLLPDTRRGWGMYGVAAVLMALVAGSVFYFSGTQSGDVAATNAPQTSVPPAKASLPVLEDRAKSPSPVKADLADRDDASATAALATPAMATEAHAAAADSEPQADETPAVKMANAETAATVEKAETKAVSAAPDATEADGAKASKVEASKAETGELEASETKTSETKASETGSNETAASETDRAALQPAYLASSDVFIRARPDNDGAVLGVVNRCEPLQVLGGNRYWREVERKDGTKGWIFTDYVAQRGQAGCV